MPVTSPTGDLPDLPGDLVDALRARVDPTGGRPLTLVVADPSGTLPAALAALAALGHAGPGLVPATSATPLAARQDVLAAGADLALLLDADRLVVLDENGEPVDASVVAALVALPEVARVRGTGPAPVVAHDVLVSRTLPDLLASAGARTERVPAGSASLAEAAGRPGTLLAVGHDGRFAVAPDGPALPGALLAALHVVAAVGAQPHPLSLVAELHRSAVASGPLEVTVGDPQAARERVVEAYVEQRGAGDVEADDLDGLTVSHWGSTPPWWFHLRATAADPVVRLHVEAADEDIMEKVRDDVLALLRLED